MAEVCGYFVFYVGCKYLFGEVIFRGQYAVWVWMGVFKMVVLSGDQTFVVCIKSNWNVLKMEVGPFLYHAQK